MGFSLWLLALLGVSVVASFIRRRVKYQKGLKNLKDKVVVITGCSEGIGVSLVQQYFAQGAKVVMAARRENLLQTVKDGLPGSGQGRVLAVRCDQAVETDCKNLIDAAIAQFGRIDALVLNACRSMNDRWVELPDPPVLCKQVFDVNFYGALYLTKYALPHLTQSKGSIVSIVSLAGKQATIRVSFYAASKAALISFYDALRLELNEATAGVSITTCVLPLVATRTALEVANPRIRWSAMTPEGAAREIQRAHVTRSREVVLSATGKVIATLRPFCPALMETVFGLAMCDDLAVGIRKALLGH
ncbi:putative short chain dehydrogenase [Paratrimastix pyriformis]|uniref:Short chain dehydrogenase n=1 Tax=Paratrimastix pyriformis TaxID=342808 RepID=A0ABQ8UIF2_9EUKA|nr:putative short chain dehydrogenase [Paratrimastix pyriformis]